MAENDIFHVCDRTNGYQFIDRVMGATQLSFSALKDFGKIYAHTIDCNDCMQRVGNSLEEFNLGSEKFSIRQFNRKLYYIEYANGYHAGINDKK